MRWKASHEDVTNEVEQNGAARSEPQRGGTLVLLARAAAHDRISAALRDARERAGLGKQEVVELLGARGVVVSIPALERWERTGGIRLEEAVDLASVYQMSLDDLAARRPGQGRFLGSLERTRADAA